MTGGGEEFDRTEMTEDEAEVVEEHHSLRTPLIYEVVRQEGVEELGRPFFSLWWSGAAAGVSMSFSVLAQAVIAQHLPDSDWSPLISKFGYCFGFVIVIMARQQLFTENTIKVVLPFAHDPSLANLGRITKLWSIVLFANICGAVISALFSSLPGAIPEETLTVMLRLSQSALDKGWLEMLFSGISAGFLMAALVWILPNAEQTRLHVIILITYIIALGEFSHIVAGSVEGLLLVVNGQLGIGTMIVSFAIPTLIGNTIGGTALFTVIAYAQVHQEI